MISGTWWPVPLYVCILGFSLHPSGVNSAPDHPKICPCHVYAANSPPWLQKVVQQALWICYKRILNNSKFPVAIYFTYGSVYFLIYLNEIAQILFSAFNLPPVVANSHLHLKRLSNSLFLQHFYPFHCSQKMIFSTEKMETIIQDCDFSSSLFQTYLCLYLYLIYSLSS